MVEMLDRLLPLEEPEVGDLLGEVLREDGIRVRTGARVERVRQDGTQTVVELEGGDAISAERLLVATGKRADASSRSTITCGRPLGCGPSDDPRLPDVPSRVRGFAARSGQSLNRVPWIRSRGGLDLLGTCNDCGQAPDVSAFRIRRVHPGDLRGQSWRRSWPGSRPSACACCPPTSSGRSRSRW
ncbi:MAG: FAD-dependent oxidoreductase [Candidatus Dormibacteraceae bacterium]